MFGFFCDTFNDNQTNLLVQYMDDNTLTQEDLHNIENNPNFYIGDSIAEAMEHFHLYTKGNSIYKHTEEENALNNIGISKDEAETFREKIDTLIQNLDDETALNNIILYPKWAPDSVYNVNDRIRYNDILYKVLQAHTALSTWTPDVTPSLFAKILVSDNPNEVADWQQPDSTNPYMRGDRVRFEGQVYESLIDNNTWSPAAYPAGWTLIEE